MTVRGSVAAPRRLTVYPRLQASQDTRHKVARVFVALPEKSREVAGFYALSAGSIEHATFPPEDVKPLPRYPVPVALIGRLAVDRRWAGQGLGSALLTDASVLLLDTTRCPSLYHHRLRG